MSSKKFFKDGKSDGNLSYLAPVFSWLASLQPAGLVIRQEISRDLKELCISTEKANLDPAPGNSL
jgi:hypothetical protein